MATPRRQLESTGPTIKRGQSSGDIWTPQIFIDAIVKRFGNLDWDLAAEPHSAKAELFIEPSTDSLTVEWSKLPVAQSVAAGGARPLCWLNPPYGNIGLWAKKCMEESKKGAQILFLVPASVGANWYWNYVEPWADVYSVGRMVFDNCFDKHGKLVTTPYSKDLILAHYYADAHERSKMRWWVWKS